MKKKNRKFVHCFDYNGEYIPYNHSIRTDTFSVGIFQWVPTTSASGLKKDVVVYRVRGYCKDFEKVYERAEDICDQLDNGRFPKKKSEFVK